MATLFYCFLTGFISYQSVKLLGAFIKYSFAKKYYLKDLKLTEDEIKKILPPEYFWNRQMYQKINKLIDKSMSTTNYFFKDIDMTKIFPEKDAYALLTILGELSLKVLDMVIMFKKTNANFIKMKYYYHKYSHNERVLKVCDPRDIYNILSVLDKIKENILQNKIEPITKEFVNNNLIYATEYSML